MRLPSLEGIAPRKSTIELSVRKGHLSVGDVWAVLHDIAPVLATTPATQDMALTARWEADTPPWQVLGDLMTGLQSRAERWNCEAVGIVRYRGKYHVSLIQCYDPYEIGYSVLDISSITTMPPRLQDMAFDAVALAVKGGVNDLSAYALFYEWMCEEALESEDEEIVPMEKINAEYEEAMKINESILSRNASAEELDAKISRYKPKDKHERDVLEWLKEAVWLFSGSRTLHDYDPESRDIEVLDELLPFRDDAETHYSDIFRLGFNYTFDEMMTSYIDESVMNYGITMPKRHYLLGTDIMDCDKIGNDEWIFNLGEWLNGASKYVS